MVTSAPLATVEVTPRIYAGISVPGFREEYRMRPSCHILPGGPVMVLAHTRKPPATGWRSGVDREGLPERDLPQAFMYRISAMAAPRTRQAPGSHRKAVLPFFPADFMVLYS